MQRRIGAFERLALNGSVVKGRGEGAVGLGVVDVRGRGGGGERRTLEGIRDGMFLCVDGDE